MARSDVDTRMAWRAREEFLASRDASRHPDQVRPEIAASWQRSLANGVDPQGVEPDFHPDINLDGQLCLAAKPVIDKRCEHLGGTGSSLLLGDRSGRIIERWGDGARVLRLLEQAYAEPGFSIAEDVVGTNGVGTVYETHQPALVIGGEHFSEQYFPFACAGVPIHHPITRQLEGVLDITCRRQDANNMLLPWILEVARMVEERLYQQASPDERLLLGRFLAATRRTKHAVVCLNEQTIISNPCAARLLDGVDHALLWEHAARAITADTADTAGPCALTLSDGRAVTVHCRPVDDERSTVGVLVEVLPAAQQRSRTRATGRPARPCLPHLAGHGARWQQVCDQAQRYRERLLPVLLAGEVGTGKLALARAMFADEEQVSVIDAALHPVDGFATWAAGLRRRLDDPGGVVVVRHLEALEARQAQTVCGLLDHAGDSGPRLVATLTRGQGAMMAYGPLVDRFAVATIEVPPLRERLEDLPDLIPVFTQRHAAQPGRRHWQPEVIQTLSRLDWPGNVRQLENLVRRVLVARTTGDISITDLPEDVRVNAPRRRLAQLEQVELNAIVSALGQTGGNKVEAAKILGVSRSTLYRKMRAFGLDLNQSAF